MTSAQASRTMPQWLTDFSESFRASEAHGFILHGDVDGIAFEGVSQRALLLATLASRRDVIALYALGRGITIWQADELITVGEDPNARDISRGARARELVGMAEEQPAEQPNGLAALLGTSAAPQKDPFAEATTPGQALPLLTRLLRGGKRVAVIIDHPDTIAPTAAMSGKGAMSPADRMALVQLLDLARDPLVAKLANPVFLVVKELSELHGDIRATDSGWRALYLRLPDRDERNAYVAWYLARRAEKGKPPITLGGSLTADEFANSTAGLSLRNIEDILLLGAQSGTVERQQLRAYKDRVIQQQYSDVLTMIDPLPNGFGDVGGSEQVKAWFLSDVITPIREGRYEDVPKGIMLVGPPGTGKTWMVRALARETGFNAVALDGSKLLGSLLGESEKKLARALEYATAMAPTLVFMDEIDQTDLARRGDQSGNPAAANLFNGFMQFMSDETNRGKVIVVFGTNRPDKLDPALMRNGRMDAVIPILLPQTADERAAVVLNQASAQGLALSAYQAKMLGENTDQWSNADLAALVRKVRQLQRRNPDDTEGLARHIDGALAALKPQSVTLADYYTRLAVEACNDRDLLPEKYRAMLDQRPQRKASAEQSRDVTRDERADW